MRSALARTDRYTGVAIALHWTIAALILLNLWLGLAGDSLPKDWKVMPVHKAIGITVLALTLVRIGWRVTHPAPPLPEDMPHWERVAAHANHYAFYGLMLLLPLTGWAMVSGTDKRRPLEWFGLFDIPYLPVSKAVGGLGHDLHGLFGWAMIALAVLHIGAALKHHFVARDTVLTRMLPFLRAPAG